MRRLGVSIRTWYLFGVYNAFFAGAFAVVAKTIEILAPNNSVLILENVLLAALFTFLAGLCGAIVNDPINLDRSLED